MRRKLKCSVLLGLVFTLMLGIFLVVPPTGQRGNTVQAASSPNLAMFNFVVTSVTECDVRLVDKTVTRAIVPSKVTINNVEYTVTSVAANGFASSANLEKVRLPRTVETIGQNAFMNCKKLSSITLPNVVTINANAFQMCTSLGRIIIPKTTTTVGATILRNNTTQVYFRGPKSQADEWTGTWNNNNSIQDVEYNSKFIPDLQYRYISKTVAYSSGVNRVSASNIGITPMTEYDGYWVVDDYQEFIDLDTEVDIYVPAMREGKPVVEIDQYAFAGNTLNTITIGYGSVPIRLGEGAFHSFEGHTIIMNRSFYSNDETDDVGDMLAHMFNSVKSTKIVLPNNITHIGESAFQYCETSNIYFRTPEPGLNKDQEKAIADYLDPIDDIYLPDTLTSIGAEAFDSAINIKRLHIPGPDIDNDIEGVTVVGHRAFAGWDVRGEDWQEIHIGYANEGVLPAGWVNTNPVTNLWKAGINNYSIVNYDTPQIFTIEFHHYGDVITTKTYTPKNSFSFDAATRKGYIFEYWYVPETGLRMDGITVGTTGNLSLEAKWTAITYTITYHSNKPSNASKGINGATGVNITTDPVTGNKTGTKSFTYGVTDSLDPTGYNLIGWIPNGWNTEPDGSGVSYVDGFNSVLNWAYTQGTNIMLYQQWVAKDYLINYEGNRPDKASSGVTGNPYSSAHKYDAGSPVLPSKFTLVGWTFSHWNTKTDGSGTNFYPDDLVSDLSDGGSIFLFAQWTQNPYSVVYAKNLPTKAAEAGKTVDGFMADSDFLYDEVEELSECTYELSGWIFNGWNTKSDGSGISYFDRQNDKFNPKTTSMTLYAMWVQNTYKLEYKENRPAIASNPITGETSASFFKYDETETLRANGFGLKGWTFQGWATSENGPVVYSNLYDKVYNFNGVTLFAVWKQNTYTVVYYSNRPTTATHPANASNTVGGSMANSVYWYDAESKLSSCTFTLTGWTFAGWATSPAGSVVYGNTATVWNWSPDNGKIFELYARWTQNEYTITLNRQGATNGTASVVVKYDSGMPSATAPSQTGFVFDGYYSSTNGSGTQYYDKQMNSLRNWTTTSNATLYAKWIGNSYQIAYNPNGGSGSMSTTSHIYGTSSQLSANTFTPQTGKGFKCWNTAINGTGTSYSNKEWISTGAPSGTLTLYAQWETFTYLVEVRLYGYVPPWPNGGEPGGPTYGEDFFFEYYPSFYLVWNESRDVTVPATYTAHGKTWEFYQYWSGHNTSGYSSGRTITLKNMVTEHNDRLWLNAEYRVKKTSSCVADGTLITLADGSQVAAENLTGNEMLLIWDFNTGTFGQAPMLFIDNGVRENYEVAQLFFSNGTDVTIIDAHGFFSVTLNKYVRITTKDAHIYIGQHFLMHSTDAMGNLVMTTVQLVDTDVFMHSTSTWNPITPNHFAYFANGMLTAPGLFVRMGFLNVLTVDADTLAFCQVAYQQAIDTFGLMTFEQFQQFMPELPEEFFHAFNGQYLLIMMGNGMTMEQLHELIELYGDQLGLVGGEQPTDNNPGNSGNPDNGGGNNGAGNNGNGNGNIGKGQGNGNGKGNGNGGRP